MTLRIKTQGGSEYRLALTRRYVSVLWGALEKMIERDPELQRQLQPDAKKAMMAFEHQTAVAEANFGEKHEETAEDFPLGEAPVLVVGGTCTPAKSGSVMLSLKCQDGKNVNFPLNRQLLHALCHLLITTSARANWGLKMSVGEGNVVLDKAQENRVLH